MRSLVALVCTVVTFAWGSGESTNAICSSSHCLAMPVVSVAPALNVTGFVSFRDRPGIEHIQGQVTNGSNQPVFNAWVKISGTDLNGKTVSQTVPLALPATFPGQLNPFEGRFDFFGSYPLQPQFEVITYSTTSTQNILPITVVNSHTVESAAGVVVTIMFKNETTATLKGAQAVVGAVQSAGSIYWKNERGNIYPPFQVATSLAPGEVVTRSLYVEGTTPKGWGIFAQGVASP